MDDPAAPDTPLGDANAPDPATGAVPSEPVTTVAPTPPPVGRVQRHPVRGFFFGLLLGIGVAMLTVLLGVFEMFTWTGPIAIIVGGVVIGVLWATLAPAKKPKTA